MKKYICIFCFGLLVQSLEAQIVFTPGPLLPPPLKFERKVIASAGREAKNTTTFYSAIRYMTYTIGEPVIWGGTAATSRINNGFIQPDGTAPTSQPGVTGMAQVDLPFTIYPNPTSDVFIVEAPEEQNEAVRVQLIDANGKLLREEEFTTLKHRMELPEGSVPGTYYLNFYRPDGTFLQQSKLVKMNAPNSNVAY
jgi:hypothetical protein